MAIVMTMHMPMPAEIIHAVSDEMNVHQDPPPGLLVHTSYQEGEGLRVIDVWESEQDFQTFQQSRLMPAIGKVLADRGISMDGPPPPEPEIHQAVDLVRGRS